MTQPHAPAGPPARGMNPLRDVRAVCFDWGGTLMSEDGPDDIPMGLWPQVRAIDGASGALAALKGRLPLAIATNATVSRRPMIERALQRAGLGGYFDHIFCFTEIGHRKDHPGFWHAVEQGLHVPLRHVAMLGDSYEQDALHPQGFGVQAVWFHARSAVARPDMATPMVQDLGVFAQWVLQAGAA